MTIGNFSSTGKRPLQSAALFILIVGMVTACGGDKKVVPSPTVDSGPPPNQDIEVFVPPPAGNIGSPCESDVDCDGALCVSSADGAVCSGPCDEECINTMGWVCKTTQTVPPELICVPPHPTLCTPCIDNGDCNDPNFDATSICLDMGEAGRFCGGECDDQTPCPDGYTCTEGTGIGGETAMQCWPTSGECTCSPAAIALEASTVCHNSNPIGTCLGNRSCGPDGLSDCSATEAGVEVCDGVDNDCDGAPDEDLAGLPCELDSDSGCGGLTTCTDGVSGCDPLPVQAEVCDYIDNDCDGQIDEDFPGLKEACDGPDEDQCKNGILACAADGLGTECAKESGGPQVEVCDGQDNDCDDQIDEGVKNACGDCGDVPAEVCDGKDNDCNGQVDDGVKNACGECGDVPAEVCDGKDNDCDGTPDNPPGGCTCVNGVSQSCGSSVGECAAGVQVCVDGQWSACNNKGPTTETCDGKDNDCDGTPDNAAGGCACINGQTVNCGSNLGECVQGIQVCANGQWSTCNDKGPQPETCDGKDNNCNGTPDEGCACVSGTTQTCGSNIGECTPGTETCINGQWSTCNDKGPQPETCDGKDNDCNGTPDEGCNCISGQTKACGSNVGECIAGQEVCFNGQWNACNDKGPSTEVCDGKDNDCDNQTDEDGVCAPPKACSIDIQFTCQGSGKMKYTVYVNDAENGHVYWTEMPNGIAVEPEKHNFCTYAVGPFNMNNAHACVKAHYEVGTCKPPGTPENKCSAIKCGNCP